MSLIDPGAVVNLGAGEGRLPQPQVNTILCLPDESAWVATAQGGVTHVIPDRSDFIFVSYGPPDLPNPNVEALALDPDGRGIWCGTDRGLARLLPIETPRAAGAVYAYPNPFIPGCVGGIRLLGYTGVADGVIVDVNGKIVRRFERAAPGVPVWDGLGASGQALAPGLYWIRVASPGGTRLVGVALADGPCPQ